MDLTFLMDLPNLPAWRVLKNEILPRTHTSLWKEEDTLGSYQLIYVLVDESQKPFALQINPHDVKSFVAFTRSELKERLGKVHELQDGLIEKDEEITLPQGLSLRIMMVGELMDQLSSQRKETSVKINPLPVVIGKGVEPLLYCEEVLFAPQFDEFTCKYLLTDPDDAKALLAINPDDEKRFGIEIVYYMLTNSGLPEEGEDRATGLIEKVEELAFKAPRVPLSRGSGSFMAVLLNLENEIEERAFIRDYSTFDYYSDLVFVTSSLKLWTGKLEEIHFNGEKIDTIFAPLIKWQQGKKKPMPYFLS